MDTKQVVETLKKKREEYLSLVESLNVTINALERVTGENNETTIDGYNPNMSRSEKIVFFLKKEGRFLHNRELADLVHKREPNSDPDSYVKKFSGVLSKLKKDGQLTNLIIGKSLRNTFWGNPAWLDKDGKIIKGHEVNEKYILDSNKNKKGLF